MNELFEKITQYNYFNLLCCVANGKTAVTFELPLLLLLLLLRCCCVCVVCIIHCVCFSLTLCTADNVASAKNS